MTILKIIGVIAVVICGAVSFFARKILGAVFKQEADDGKVLKLKLAMFIFVLIGALLVILPDYI